MPEFILNKRKLQRDAIDAIASAGFDVYMRDPDGTYAYFTDGTHIGYIQTGAFGGFDLSTVHKPNRTTGSSFSFYQGVNLEHLTAERLQETLTHAPSWVSFNSLKSTVKWADFAAFLAADSWNGGFHLIAKGARP